MKKNKHAQALGRLGGLVKSKEKTAASIKNGKLGGRPIKETTDCWNCSGDGYCLNREDKCPACEGRGWFYTDSSNMVIYE